MVLCSHRELSEWESTLVRKQRGASLARVYLEVEREFHVENEGLGLDPWWSVMMMMNQSN